MMIPGLPRPLRTFVAAVLTAAIGFAQAPQQVPTPAAPPSVPSTLRIIVLEGNNASNSIPLRQSVTPIVEVRDENDFPVEGATVAFTLPESGAGGVFPGNRTSFTARSDARGQAAAPFAVNTTPGRFRIQVTATAGSRKGEFWIDQTNTSGAYVGPEIPRKPWYKKRTIWLIVGAAAVAGTVVALTWGGSSSSDNITIIGGGPVFSGPR